MAARTASQSAVIVSMEWPPSMKTRSAAESTSVDCASVPEPLENRLVGGWPLGELAAQLLIGEVLEQIESAVANLRDVRVRGRGPDHLLGVHAVPGPDLHDAPPAPPVDGAEQLDIPTRAGPEQQTPVLQGSLELHRTRSITRHLMNDFPPARE